MNKHYYLLTNGHLRLNWYQTDSEGEMWQFIKVKYIGHCRSNITNTEGETWQILKIQWGQILEHRR